MGLSWVEFFSQAFDLVEKEGKVVEGGARVDMDHAEGGIAVDGAVIDHDLAGVVDGFADAAGGLVEGLEALLVAGHSAKGGRDIVEEHICALGFAKELEILALPHEVCEVGGEGEEIIDALFKAFIAQDLPGQPGFDGVDAAAALKA